MPARLAAYTTGNDIMGAHDWIWMLSIVLFLGMCVWEIIKRAR